MLWHWLDKRLQSQQEVQEAGDRSFSYLAEYRVQPKKFIRLADEDVRTVSLAPKQRFAIGLDSREYELLGNLDGRRFQDVYAIDMATGERRLALKRARWYNGPSPMGSRFSITRTATTTSTPMESGQARNITLNAPDLFRRHRRRPQRRQAADRFDRLDEGQRVGAAAPTTGTSGRCRSTAARSST